VTPNGDNINDTFKVEGIEACGYRVELKVYNRWGALVYQSQNYQNNWAGTSNGNHLAAGTYFYILNIIGSDFGTINGFIYLGTSS
jgi:gliding motility-associated-like protein